MLGSGTPTTYNCLTLPAACSPTRTCMCIPESVECQCAPTQGSFTVSCPPL
jgi:hypothetical protein